MSQAFSPPDGGWQQVSPKLVTVRRLSVVPWIVLVTVGATVAAGLLLDPVWGVPPLLVGLAVTGWAWWLIGRQVRAIGYAERGEDLLVTSGILFKRLVIVPYGRMQLVDVAAGPLDQRFGLATLQLHTAAATTDASIPGLPKETAGALRDRLAALGEARTSGL